ncbi:SDR family NAD(P)-dependent oxidoreductase [Actinoplanes awajinensis]|nr:SDR family oxidoreductase [Actinoplanes awajinensis]
MYVVTGGGTGLGRAIALELDRNKERVLITGRREAPLAAVARETDGRIGYLAGDNAEPAVARELAAAVTEPVQGLIHCAGGNPAIGRDDPDGLDEVAALLDETVAGNLRSAALTVTTLDEHLAADASVVLFGSIAAERGVGFYGPAKAAVASYAVGLAGQLGARGIRVNCVSPGYIAETEFFGGGLSAEREETLREQTALGRVGVPADAVGLVMFLLSPAARHVTAQTLHLNGGAHPTR